MSENETVVVLPRTKLKSWRVDKGWTLERAAAEFGCSQAHLSNVEAGERGVGLELACVLQHHCGIDPYEWIRHAGK